MTEVTLHTFRQSLRRCGVHVSSDPEILCAVSGGLDSMVLVHLLSRLGVTLRAIHVDHASHPDSAEWAIRVGRQLDKLGVDVTVERLNPVPETGNLEEYWRDARRERFRHALAEREILATAHHKDDQVETLLLLLLRGSGPVGLQAMPARGELSGHVHVRPLLDHTRAELEHYAGQQGLEWIDDPSNRDARFARNHLRHHVLPELVGRWPGAVTAIARSRELIAESVALNDVLARQDCVIRNNGRRLDWSVLIPFDEVRQANAVRYWLRLNGARPPARQRLTESLRQWRDAASDRLPTLTLAEGAVQRYRDELVFAPAVSTEPGARLGRLACHAALRLPDGFGSLAWKPVSVGSMPAGLMRVAAAESAPAPCLATAASVEDRIFEVRLRRGGEKLRRKSGHHQSLKHWFQDRGVPPVLRNRLPLVFYRDELVAVADIWIDARFRPGKDTAAEQKVYRLIWSGAGAD